MPIFPCSLLPSPLATTFSVESPWHRVPRSAPLVWPEPAVPVSGKPGPCSCCGVCQRPCQVRCVAGRMADRLHKAVTRVLRSLLQRQLGHHGGATASCASARMRRQHQQPPRTSLQHNARIAGAAQVWGSCQQVSRIVGRRYWPASLCRLSLSICPCRPVSLMWVAGGLAAVAAAGGWAIISGTAASLLAALKHYLASSMLAKSGFFAAFRWGLGATLLRCCQPLEPEGKVD